MGMMRIDGEPKEYHLKGFVGADPSNADWGMHFVWPTKAEYTREIERAPQRW